MELAVDRVIAERYRLLEPIGAGGSSEVFLAHDVTLGRQVAIKLLDQRAAGDDGLRRLFAKEGRALAQVTHPNVVSVYDVGELDGRPFIVMENVQGVALKQRIERTGALTLADALRIGGAIAAGLDFTHSRGIIHADLKPSNILLDRDDEPKICDFGIARAPQEDADTPQLFATAMYVAPERIEGKRASVSSDIYGLGLLLYEMLVGHPPFRSANASVLMRDHVIRQPVPPSHLRPSLPKELDAIVLKTLAKDPALRYRRVSDVADALRGVGETGTTQRFVTEPIRDFVPRVEQSPVVRALSAHGRTIRHAFFAVFAAAPVLGLALVAGFELFPSILLAGLVAAIAAIGQLGLALALAWILETALIAMFVPVLAVLFALVGIGVWSRGVKAEQAALALAMPVAAPFGLAPALVLTASAVHGLSGVVTAMGGAILTVIFGIASGRQALGPFAQTGLTLQQESLFALVDAVESKSAVLRLLEPSPGDGPLDAIVGLLEPERLVNEMGGLIGRLGAAGLVPVANIAAWAVAALAVWVLTRLLRGIFDTVLRRRAWFTLYVFAAAVGVAGGAMLMYMLYTVAGALANAPGRIADDVLFISALTGALLALAAGVVIGATQQQEPTEENAPAMAARRSPAG